MDRHVHLDKQLDKQLHRGAKPELGKERNECTEGESMLHEVIDMLPLLGKFDSASVEEEPEPEADMDSEIVEQLDGLKLSKMTTYQQISTIAVDLKVSQELLQQASRSLDTVEKHHHLDHRGVEQLDSVTGLRDAPPCIHTVSSCASSTSSFSMSSTNISVGTAVEPHSKWYSLLPRMGDHWGKNLETQLLRRNWELLSQAELALWLSHYPAEQQHYV